LQIHDAKKVIVVLPVRALRSWSIWREYQTLRACAASILHKVLFWQKRLKQVSRKYKIYSVFH